MSKIALKGNVSGTGTFQIEAPNSNTDRTLTLPDEAGTVLTSGTPLSSFPSGFANGITSADIWRLTTSVTTNDVVLTNLEQPDGSGVGVLGASMSVASGVFTFPSTGIWLILSQARIVVESADNATQVVTELSTDGGSAYTGITLADGGSTDAHRVTTYSQAMVDVTNTSNFRVRFKTSSLASGNSVAGNSDSNFTSFTFIRLGDT